MRWYKNTIRRDEVTLLLQGLSLPSPSVCSLTPLPPLQERPVSPPPPLEQPHTFDEPEDTLGQAQVRGVPPSAGASLSVPPPPSPTLTSAPKPEQPCSTSRTTDWRRRKHADLGLEPTAPKKPRKEYSCRFCGQPMSAGKWSKVVLLLCDAYL